MLQFIRTELAGESLDTARFNASDTVGTEEFHSECCARRSRGMNPTYALAVKTRAKFCSCNAMFALIVAFVALIFYTRIMMYTGLPFSRKTVPIFRRVVGRHARKHSGALRTQQRTLPPIGRSSIFRILFLRSISNLQQQLRRMKTH